MSSVRRHAPGRETQARLGIGRLFESMLEAVVVADDTGRIVLWNPAAAHLFGYSESEAFEMNVSQLVPEEHKRAHFAGMRRFAATGHGRLLDSRRAVEMPALRKDGTRIMVELTLASVEESGERFAIALLRDVSDRVRLREELERRNANLEDLNDSLESFAYVVSHDLKEPVRAIQAFTRALLDDHGSKLPEEAKRMMERTAATSERLARLTEGLLEFSRASTLTAVERVPIGLSQLVTAPECAARFEHVMRERDAALVVRDGPPFAGSFALASQALGNFILNAIRHNPKPTPRVLVTAREDPDDAHRVLITIEDDGPGVPTDVVRRLQQLKSGRPATLHGGFGLIIARRAVERLDGTLNLTRSDELGGARVELRLPASPPA